MTLFQKPPISGTASGNSKQQAMGPGQGTIITLYIDNDYKLPHAFMRDD
jgi:hypothetical protein